MDISLQLINWYTKNKRDLPWRRTSDPYKIWLSEIILQQTRVDQGMDYYNRFIEKYKTIHELAAATEDDILKMWQGLGYYSRARNMHHTAKEIVEKYSGKFPSEYETLLKLKGIGPYSAAAIASIAFDKPHAVVDGNVIRVISRIYGISTPVETPDTMRRINEIVLHLIQNRKPSVFNQAIMEFGALYCTPNNPDCKNCLFSKKCEAYKNTIVNQIPNKEKKTKIRKRYLYYFVISFNTDDEEYILLQKRIKKDIWHNLYDFPHVESDKQLDPDKDFIKHYINDFCETDRFKTISISRKFIHKLSHQEISALFIKVRIQKHKPVLKDPSLLVIPKICIEEYAIPRLVEKYLEESVL
jgi:A/G-specific adenine glycosylase